MNNKIKLVLRNAFLNPRTKSVIFSNDFAKSDQFLKSIEDLIYNNRLLFESARTQNMERFLFLKNLSTICSLPIDCENIICGYRFNFVYLLDGLESYNEKFINEVARPFLSVNFDPKHNQDIMDLENELVKLEIITENERTKFPKNELIDLGEII